MKILSSHGQVMGSYSGTVEVFVLFPLKQLATTTLMELPVA